MLDSIRFILEMRNARIKLRGNCRRIYFEYSTRCVDDNRLMSELHQLYDLAPRPFGNMAQYRHEPGHVFVYLHAWVIRRFPYT